MTSKAKILPHIHRRRRVSKKQRLDAPISYSSITSKASEIPNSSSSNLMELGNPGSVAPVPDSFTTSEALEIPKSPGPNLMEFGNPSSVHLADGPAIQAAAAAQSPKNGANFDCPVSRELNQNSCLKPIPNHGNMEYRTSGSDIASCSSFSTESSYDSFIRGVAGIQNYLGLTAAIWSWLFGMANGFVVGLKKQKIIKIISLFFKENRWGRSPL